MTEFRVEFQYEFRDCREYDEVYVHANNEEEAIDNVKNGLGFTIEGYPKRIPRNAFKFKII